MSWKSFVTAGLLCIVASPVLAAPRVQIVPGGTAASGHLNAAGNWVWRVNLYQSDPIVDVDDGGPITPGSPLGAELGFTLTGGALLGAANLNDGFSGATNLNPGQSIYGWETLTDTDGDGSTGTGACGTLATPCLANSPTRDLDDEPIGVQFSQAFDQVFSALGSVDYGLDDNGKGYVTIEVQGPSTAAGRSLSTTIELEGDYGGNGRIAELNPDYDGDGTPPFSINHDIYAGMFTRTARPGDADLNGDVDDADLSFINGNWFDTSGTLTWKDGDFDGNGDVDDADLSFVNGNWFEPVVPMGMGGFIPGPGSGGGGTAVPEPATIAMVALAGLGLIGLRRRHS